MHYTQERSSQKTYFLSFQLCSCHNCLEQWISVFLGLGWILTDITFALICERNPIRSIWQFTFQVWWLDLCNNHTVKMRMLEHLVCVWQLLCHLTLSHWSVCSPWEWIQDLALQVCLLNCFCWRNCQQWHSQATDDARAQHRYTAFLITILSKVQEQLKGVCGHALLGNC